MKSKLFVITALAVTAWSDVAWSAEMRVVDHAAIKCGALGDASEKAGQPSSGQSIKDVTDSAASTASHGQ